MKIRVKIIDMSLTCGNAKAEQRLMESLKGIENYQIISIIYHDRSYTVFYFGDNHDYNKGFKDRADKIKERSHIWLNKQ